MQTARPGASVSAAPPDWPTHRLINYLNVIHTTVFQEKLCAGDTAIDRAELGLTADLVLQLALKLSELPGVFLSLLLK